MEAALTGGKRLSAFEREALIGKLEAAIYDLDKLLMSGELLVEAAEKRAAEADARPHGICQRCHAALTRTPEELRQHIAIIAEQAHRQQGWPIQAFIEKVSAALQPGDEIVWLVIGGASIRRRDGSGYVVWRADG